MWQAFPCTVPRGVGSITASARKNVDGLPTMPSLVLEENVLYISYGKSFLARIVRTGFRMHRQERWLDCTCLKKKLLFQLPWKSPVAAKANGFYSRQALLGKDILDTEPGVAGTTLLITVNCQDRLMSGGHGFKLYRSRRCWLNHCIRQKAARKNVDGLSTMPS